MAGGKKSYDLRNESAKFATTKWSIVLAAAGNETSDSRDALENLCQTYWFPLYAFVRKQGRDANESADMTQAFFASLLERNDLKNVRPDKGKFRSFLLASMKHFLINQFDRQQAVKRGGSKIIVSIDATAAENRYRLEPFHELTPETIFEKQWALAILDRVKALLADEYASRGSGKRFSKLQIFLAGKTDESSIVRAAEELGMTEVAVKVAVHRMRSRFRDLLRAEIAGTVDAPEEVDAEIRHLFDVLKT